MVATPSTNEVASPARQPHETASDSPLLALPAELIQHILALLPPLDLATVAKTCRHLSVQSYDDQIWLPIVNSNLPHPISSPGPANSFRELYIAHHPNWFLPKRRIWFGDTVPNGKLLLARYNEEQGCIEAHTLVGTRGTHQLSFWEKDREVIIHSFEPKVSLDLHQPVVKLNINSAKAKDPTNNAPNDQSSKPTTRYSREVLMETFAESGLYSSLMLCRSLPETAITQSTFVWPPLRIPAQSRTRNESRDGFSSTGHRPTTYQETSQDNFRIRKWAEYTGRRSSSSVFSFGTGNGLSAALGGIGVPYFATGLGPTRAGGMPLRIPEDITTYSTLPESCYVPTQQKPWQGIWCGDYSGHGCEFLVITQPDREDERPLPQGMDWLRLWIRGGRRGSASTDASFASAVEEQETPTSPDNEDMPSANHLEGLSASSLSKHVDDYDTVPSGRLEAIKLTGDPNIPRGEYTFISPDIGHGGFVRVADEGIFRGARVVRSAGHIAGRNFRHDQYTPSQLIMISHDRLAQFWEGFGHISYYQRVDLDALTKYHG